MNTKRSLSFLVLSSLFFQACAPSLPNFKKSAMPLPAEFPVQNPGAASEQSAGEITWKEFFKDRYLSQMIGTALKNNQELNILEQDIMIVNNEIMARRGEYLPRAGLQGDTGVNKSERFSPIVGDEPIHSSRVGVAASWEIDVWGKLRNATKVAYYDYLATIEGRRFAVTRLVAEIANDYYELLALDSELAIVNNYVHTLQQIKNMVELQRQAARTTSLAVKRFEAEVLKNQSRQYKLQQQIIVTQNHLNILMGRFPQDIQRSSKDFIHYATTPIKSSLPSKLLDNRPDIRRAAMEMEAAKLNVSVAKARFYPSLSIDGSAGYEKFNSKHFEGESVASFYGIAAGLTAPLINRRAIKASYLTANNNQVQKVYEYEQTLVKAYAEVVNQLNAIKNISQMFELKSKQVKALNESFNISTILFRAARVDYIEALMTQRDALEAQIELVEAKKQQLTSTVNLYRALGGGWKGLVENYKSNY
jgi:NodT family efflux transporter outer membrane factor (OMF) lipoprotein